MVCPPGVCGLHFSPRDSLLLPACHHVLFYFILFYLILPAVVTGRVFLFPHRVLPLHSVLFFFSSLRRGIVPSSFSLATVFPRCIAVFAVSFAEYSFPVPSQSIHSLFPRRVFIPCSLFPVPCSLFPVCSLCFPCCSLCSTALRCVVPVFWCNRLSCPPCQACRSPLGRLERGRPPPA